MIETCCGHKVTYLHKWGFCYNYVEEEESDLTLLAMLYPLSQEVMKEIMAVVPIILY